MIELLGEQVWRRSRYITNDIREKPMLISRSRTCTNLGRLCMLIVCCTCGWFKIRYKGKNEGGCSGEGYYKGVQVMYMDGVSNVK